jgi:hypothetical protein
MECKKFCGDCGYLGERKVSHKRVVVTCKAIAIADWRTKPNLYPALAIAHTA